MDSVGGKTILRSCKYTAMCTGQRAMKLQLVGGRPVAEFIDRFSCGGEVCLLGTLTTYTMAQ